MILTRTDPLGYFKVRYSKNNNGTNFKHTDIDKLPLLSYRFAEGDNWKATDYRVSERMEEIAEWHDKYWEKRPAPSSFMNRGLYEKDLEDTIMNALNDLNERWLVKLEKEFEEAFDDKLLGFLSGQKQNR
jgi:hypothetical protein